MTADTVRHSKTPAAVCVPNARITLLCVRVVVNASESDVAYLSADGDS